MSLKIFLIMIGCGFLGLLAFATVYKYIEVRAASRWPSAPGRVLSSRVVQRRAGGIGGDEKDVELRNFAEVTYEFEASGKKYRGNRISIGEDLGNFQVEETLAKYPKGKAVTVFYNPLKPDREAVLERDIPEGAFKFMGWLIGGLIMLGVLLTFGIERLNEWLKMALPQGNSSLAIMFGFMGTFALLIALASSRAARATGNWQTAQGKIEESQVEEFQTLTESNERMRWTRMKRPRIVYSYTVNGREYKSDKVNEGWKASASFGFLARRKAAQFAPGQPVEVFYNPANPAEALLDRRVKGGGFTYLVALAFLAAAGKAAGLF